MTRPRLGPVTANPPEDRRAASSRGRPAAPRPARAPPSTRRAQPAAPGGARARRRQRARRGAASLPLTRAAAAHRARAARPRPEPLEPPGLVRRSVMAAAVPSPARGAAAIAPEDGRPAARGLDGLTRRGVRLGPQALDRGVALAVRPHKPRERDGRAVAREHAVGVCAHARARRRRGRGASARLASRRAAWARARARALEGARLTHRRGRC